MKIPNVLHRIGHIAMWQYIHRVHPLADRLSLRWGRAARLLRWPLPAMAPYRRRRLDVVRPMALGDILMCTPALREVKRLNPACRVTFYTAPRIRSLAASCPFVDAVRPADEAPPDAVWMLYEYGHAPARPPPRRDRAARTRRLEDRPPARHLARILGDSLGVDVRDVRPSCTADPAEVDRFRRAWNGPPAPLGRGRPGGRRLHPEQGLAGRILGDAARPPADPLHDHRGGDDAHGRIAAPDPIPTTSTSSATPPCRSCWRRSPPPTCSSHPRPASMHIAAAVGTPAVVIFGGYIDPVATGYPGNIHLYSPVECAPAGSAPPAPTPGSACTRSPRTGSRPRSDRLWRGGDDRIRAGGRGRRRPVMGSSRPRRTAARAINNGTPRIPESR